MKTRNYVIAALLAAFCLGYSSPSRSQQAPGAYQTKQAPGGYQTQQAPGGYQTKQAPGAYQTKQAPRGYQTQQAPRGYRPYQAPGAYNEVEPTLRGTRCGENGLYSNGTGTCCSRIQTNPPSCQPPPLALRRY